MNGVVVLEPGVELAKNGLGVGSRIASDVVAFEGLDEGSRHAVGLRAAHRGEAGPESYGLSKVDRIVRGVAAAVVGEPLDSMRGSAAAEATLDGKAASGLSPSRR